MTRPRRRWDQVSWWLSLLFVIPAFVLASGQVLGFGPGSDSPKLTVQVTDQASGARISGATVAIGGEVKQTNNNGEAKFDRPDSDTLAQVVAPGYSPMYGSVGSGFGQRQIVALRSLTIPAGEGDSVPDQASVAATEESTDEADSVAKPTNATVEPTATIQAAGGIADGVVASGKVLGEDGKGIDRALVLAGGKSTRTKSSGSFALKNADVSNGIVVMAPGYAKQELAAGNDLSIQMERQEIKALYLNGSAAGDDATVDHLIKLIDDTEVNAVVIDIKEGVVFYDTKVQFFRDADAVDPTYDPAALVQKFKEHGIYTIARQVVFNDPKVAEANHDLAVQDEVSGDVWRGYDGGAWVNPFKRELWQPNIDLAVEAAGFGFDEIQYDYIRFPSDGDLSTADFGSDYSEEGRVAAIVDFLKESHKALEATGTMLAVDLFGIVAIYSDDQGIGQRFADIAPVVDYVCPMIYPSHFDPTSIDVGGDPNDLPYETIQTSVYLALEKMPGMELKLRPWLQDFPWGDQPYDAEQVRAQITATEEQAGSGWILWNAGSKFTEDALNPA
jgi:hypothetical protein